MNILRIFNRAGSHAARVIREEVGIRRYVGNEKNQIDAVINYGLSGDALHRFIANHPSLKRYPILNRQVEASKLRALRKVEKSGIRVPESRASLNKPARLSDWIEKRYASQGGRGIRMATRYGEIPGKYFQRFIKDRPYELRVHTFKWIEPEKWHVQRRVGDRDKVAWNHEQGGFFSSVYNPSSRRACREALSYSQKILDVLGMHFGAVDFVLDSENNVYFIEINSAPGFTELSQGIYVNAFRALKELSKKELNRILK